MTSRLVTGGFCLIVIVLLFASLGQAQSIGGVGSSIQAPYTNSVQMPDHAAHASQHTLATEQDLLGNGNVTSAHGERPLWEFGSDKVERPLGDVAREYRNGHPAEKARIVWNGNKDGVIRLRYEN